MLTTPEPARGSGVYTDCDDKGDDSAGTSRNENKCCGTLAGCERNEEIEDAFYCNDAVAVRPVEKSPSSTSFQSRSHDNKNEKSAQRDKHCALAVVRRSQHFSPRRRPLSRGRAGWPKFNQLEMVTTFTYKPSLVRIDACNFELSW